MGAFTVSFLTIFYFTIAPGKLTDNSLYGIGVVQQNRKLLPKIEKQTKKKSQAEKKQNKQPKPKEIVNGSLFTGEESFNSGDKDYLVSKDGLAPL